MIDESIKERLVGAKAASGRARCAFTAATTAALAVLALAWNAYLSWHRADYCSPTGSAVSPPASTHLDQPLDTPEHPPATGPDHETENLKSLGPDELAGIRRLRDVAKSNWVRALWLNLGPLGVQAGVGDAGIVSGLGVTGITVWYFFAARKENHTVAGLLVSLVPLLLNLA